MITYPISSNFCKSVSQECYWLYNFPSYSYLLLFKISYLFYFKRKKFLKKGNTLMEFKDLPFCSSIDLFHVKDFKRNLTDGNLIRKCV